MTDYLDEWLRPYSIPLDLSHLRCEHFDIPLSHPSHDGSRAVVTQARVFVYLCPLTGMVRAYRMAHLDILQMDLF